MNTRTVALALCVCLTMLVLLTSGCPSRPNGTAITMSPPNAVLEVGQSINVSAESSSALDALAWATSDPEVATVTPASGATVVVAAIAPGTAEITATGSLSGAVGTCTISVPVGGDDPPPPGPLGAGLNVTIESVTVPADLRPEVAFTATNEKGGLVALAELSDVRMMLAYLETPAEGSTTRFLSYTTANEDPDGKPGTGDEALQAVYDNARLAGVTQKSDGTMVYKFKAAIPAGYDVTATHRVAGQFQRVYPIDNVVYPANAVLDYRPDGNTVTANRHVSTTAVCNDCHARLTAHGSRREFDLCIVCHNTQSTDANSGNSVDMPVMIHKIHRGESLPSVEAGGKYQIVGYRGAVHDYSTVVFPQDIRNCTVCHKEGTDAAVYLNAPTRAGCGSCHDRTWFGKPAETPEGWENHPLNFEHVDDSGCAFCHPATGTGVSPIDAAHRLPKDSGAAPGLSLAITNVAANADAGTVTLTIAAKFGDGSPVTNLASLDRLGATIAYPASDYQKYVNENIQGTGPAGTLDTKESPTGVYSYTFKATFPTETGDTYAVGLEGRLRYTLGDVAYTQGTDSNGLTFFTFDGSEPEPRRTVVDEAKCNLCHSEMRFHGDQRFGVDYCLLCHNTKTTDASRRPGDQMPPVTVNLKDMLHLIHTGEELEQGYVVFGFGSNRMDFGEVRFPADRRACTVCHADGTMLLPVAAEAQPTIVMQGTEFVSATPPEQAACNTCHDSAKAVVHAMLNTGNDGIETCSICHGAGADFDVVKVHAIEP